MASPVITQMLTYPNIKILHIEPTDVCQAACPQCGRELESSFNKHSRNHLSVDTINNLLGINTIKCLDKMFMCGNYGDPAAGKHTLSIFKYFRQINPNITLGMNTNGGIGTNKWWTSLAKILNQTKDYVVFSIDGLEDTNHLYRKNVNWNKVINNATTFINAGGNAHWEMLVFEHNQHQIDKAKEMATNLGFKFFNNKVSQRFRYFPIENLNPPKFYKDQNIEGDISCVAIQEQSLYISATGKIHPCCWLGYQNGYTIEHFESIQKSWTTKNPQIVCKQSCSTNNTKSNFNNQWTARIQINSY